MNRRTLGMFAVLTAYFLGLSTTIACSISHQALWGTLGALLWLVGAVLSINFYTDAGAAAIPVLQLFKIKVEGGNRLDNGIASFFANVGYNCFIYPLWVLGMMLFGWLFPFIALIRSKPTGIHSFLMIVSFILIVAFPLALTGIGAVSDYLASPESARGNYDSVILPKVEAAIAELKPEPVVFTEEEQQLLDQAGISAFSTGEAYRLIANRYAAAYADRDFDEIMRIVQFCSVNKVFSLVMPHHESAIAFVPGFIEFVADELESRAVRTSSGSRAIAYSYGEWEIVIYMDKSRLSINPVDEEAGFGMTFYSLSEVQDQLSIYSSIDVHNIYEVSSDVSIEYPR